MSKKDNQYYADKIAETIGIEGEDIQETFETYERIWDASNHFINLVGMEEISERKNDPCGTWYDMFTAFVCHMMLRTDKTFVTDMLKDVSGRLDWYEEWNQNRVDEGQMVALSKQELQDKQDAMIERVVNEEVIH
tara:strand:- start:1 stop:405 length:405 start_codon:yes stop_codon:yes gene_type:complete